jgi:tubulin-specific chaperone E
LWYEEANRTINKMAETSFDVGQRVQSVEKGARKIGTVKYVGPVQGYEGIWAGVDWDDGEGRHNGSVNGVRYFEAAGDKSASFVRLHSLSKGVTFLEALLRRYKGDAISQEEQGMAAFSP